ncbi:MAG: uroporphyrinogen-III C-methyltransferase [Planctomycetota bacterium]
MGDSVPATVYLVGAGPGDPRLISVRGKELLEAADVVLYDGLVSPLLFANLRADLEYAGRATEDGRKRVLQPEINARLIELARSGRRVVRLKGGDPFVFGRGGEEAAALAAAGVPFEIVPGVTAAVAAAEYAGISLTHRAHASSIAFVTGHEDPNKPGRTIDYDRLAGWPGTVVFYMGLNRLGRIAAELLARGADPATPACVVSRGTTGLHRTVSGRLDDITDKATAAGLKAPSLIITGACVAERHAIDWFESKPLLGRRLLVTRPAGQADEAVALALDLGAEPILCPLIEIGPPDDWKPVDDAIDRLAEFDWLVFTSVNGVAYFLDRLFEAGGDARRLGHLRLAAVGPATADALAARGLRADVVPQTFRAEALAEELRPHVADARVLWAGANIGREVLIEERTAAGATVEKVAVYTNREAESLPEPVAAHLAAGEIDWVLLSSPSIARNYARLSGRYPTQSPPKVAAISPVTADAAREAGLPIDVTAAPHTWAGLLDAVRDHVAGRLDV